MRRANFVIKKRFITTKGMFFALMVTSVLGVCSTFQKSIIQNLTSINTTSLKNRVIASVNTKVETPVVENKPVVAQVVAVAAPAVEVKNVISNEFTVLEEKIKSQKIIGVESIEREKNSNSILIVLESDVFFKLGTANLEEKSKNSIQEVIEILKPISVSSFIEIEGHTDGSPIIRQKVNYPSNWELSAARAASLIPLFSSSGFFKDQMKVVGYGDSRPRYSNHMNNEISAKNRRIVLHVFTQGEERKI